MESKGKSVVQLERVLGCWVGSWAQLFTSPKSTVGNSWSLRAVGRGCRGLGLCGAVEQHPPRAVGMEWGRGSSVLSSLPLFPSHSGTFAKQLSPGEATP